MYYDLVFYKIEQSKLWWVTSICIDP